MRHWRQYQLAKTDVFQAQQNILFNIVRQNEHTRFGKDHSFSSIDSIDKFFIKVPISEYDDYTSELLNIDKKCMTKNLRGVFDDIEKEVYWDEGHLNDFGNYLIAKKFYELYNLDFISNISKDGTQLISENSFAMDFDIPLSFQEIVSYYKTPVLLN